VDPDPSFLIAEKEIALNDHEHSPNLLEHQKR
jgi:hypothetical protein